MDNALQELVWAKLPLNEFQRQDMLKNLIQELAMDKSASEVKQNLEKVPQKKRRRATEQCESQNHTC
jgi:hypothetical protein